MKKVILILFLYQMSITMFCNEIFLKYGFQSGKMPDGELIFENIKFTIEEKDYVELVDCRGRLPNFKGFELYETVVSILKGKTFDHFNSIAIKKELVKGKSIYICSIKVSEILENGGQLNREIVFLENGKQAKSNSEKNMKIEKMIEGHMTEVKSNLDETFGNKPIIVKVPNVKDKVIDTKKNNLPKYDITELDLNGYERFSFNFHPTAHVKEADLRHHLNFKALENLITQRASSYLNSLNKDLDDEVELNDFEIKCAKHNQDYLVVFQLKLTCEKEEEYLRKKARFVWLNDGQVIGPIYYLE